MNENGLEVKQAKESLNMRDSHMDNEFDFEVPVTAKQLRKYNPSYLAFGKMRYGGAFDSDED
jgi:hypothetical protein